MGSSKRLYEELEGNPYLSDNYFYKEEYEQLKQDQMEEIDVQDLKNKLTSLQKSTDTESAHSQADDVLCELLRRLGYNEIVEEYDKIDKWFA